MKQFALLLLSAALFAACASPEAAPPRTSEPKTVALSGAPRSAHQARVVSVTDGDTIVLAGIDVGEIHRSTGGRKARLIGVDTPELFGEQECFGSQAAAFTKEALGGTTVLIDFDVDKIDRYGRALVYVWQADGAFFNARIVEEGYAQQATFPPNVRYVDLFTGLAREAREAGRGLWTRCA